MNIKWKCINCDKELILKTNRSQGGHFAKCKKTQELNEKLLTKEILEEFYINQQKSLPAMAEYFGFDSWSPIITALKRHNIEKRSHEEAVKLPGRHERYKATCIEKYGVKNLFCRESENRKNWEKRLLEEEGITNVFQRESVKKKSIESMIKNHGVNNAVFLSKTGKTYTKIHKMVVEELQKNNFEIEIEKKLLKTERLSKFSNYYYSYDIWIKNTFKLIEVNGDFWHANPNFYKENDIIICGSYRPLAKEIWEKDRLKIEFAKVSGYEILVVWEQELKHNREKEIKRIVQWTKNENY